MTLPWRPEAQPSVDYSDTAKTQRGMLEWLARSFNKLSLWSGQLSQEYVEQGYGGLYLGSSQSVSLPLSTTPVKIDQLDTETTQNPVAVEQDEVNDRIAILEQGIWAFSFMANGQLLPQSANDANAVMIQVYNETKAQGVGLTAYSPVARFVDVFSVTLSGIAVIDENNVGDYFSMWISQYGVSPSITVTDWDTVDMSVYRVGNGN